MILAEFEFSCGRFIALGCKSYTGYNAVTGESKRGTKGVPHKIPLELKQFRDCLYQKKKHRIRIQTLQKDVNHQMSRFSREKIGLTDFYVKHFVAADKISCSPIRINNKLI